MIKLCCFRRSQRLILLQFMIVKPRRTATIFIYVFSKLYIKKTAKYYNKSQKLEINRYNSRSVMFKTRWKEGSTSRNLFNKSPHLNCIILHRVAILTQIQYPVYGYTLENYYLTLLTRSKSIISQHNIAKQVLQYLVSRCLLARNNNADQLNMRRNLLNNSSKEMSRWFHKLH